MPLHVFDDDDGLVDEQTNHERHPAERHGVEGFLREVEANERAQAGQRHRHDNDEHGPVAAEKNQHEQRGQPGAERGFLREIADGVADEHGLVHHHVEVDALDAFEDGLELRFDAFDDGDGVRARLAVNRDIDLPLTVHADDVQLNLAGVLHLRHVANERGRAIAHV